MDIMHSLCSIGAMTMHIAGVPNFTPIDIVMWWSLVFMVYIQHQISYFSTGVLVRTNQHPWLCHLWQRETDKIYMCPQHFGMDKN